MANKKPVTRRSEAENSKQSKREICEEDEDHPVQGVFVYNRPPPKVYNVILELNTTFGRRVQSVRYAAFVSFD